MAKDPAFLFYPQDFLTGCMFMSDEDTGIYIRLLCAQHQQGGMIDKDVFESIVKDKKLLKNKFVETDEGYYNKRLMEEMEKRSVKSSNLSANAKVRWEKEKQKQCKSNAIASAKDMPIETEDENVNKDVTKPKVKKEYTFPETILMKISKPEKVWKEYHLQHIPVTLHNETFILNWVDWIDHLISKKKRPTENAAKKQLEKLSKVDNPNLWLTYAIEHNWHGLYEPQFNNTGNNNGHKPEQTNYVYKLPTDYK